MPSIAQKIISWFSTGERAAPSSTILFAKAHGYLYPEPDFEQSKIADVIASEQLIVLPGFAPDEGSDEAEFVHVRLKRDDTLSGYFEKEQTRPPAPGESLDQAPTLPPVNISEFADLLIDECLHSGAVPGALLAIAHIESGRAVESGASAWDNTGANWSTAVFKDFQHQEHGGVGPFQFRPGAWNQLIGYFPDEFFDGSDRMVHSGQTRIAALFEQKFFEENLKQPYSTYDLYTAFMFGIAGSAAIRTAAADKKLRDVLIEQSGNEDAAVKEIDRELGWRKHLLPDGPLDTTIATFRTTTEDQLTASLTVAAEIIEAIATPEDRGSFSQEPDSAGDNIERFGGAKVLPGSGDDTVLFRPRQRLTKWSRPNMLVSILQAGLKHRGQYTGIADGIYGDATATAMRVYQQAQNLTQDGICRESDWIDITGTPPPSIFDRCLHLTAAFEGTGFDKVEGNFDGAYVTWGMTGYTLKHDMPKFIEKVERRYPGIVEAAFGSDYNAFMSIIRADRATRKRWANGVSGGKNNTRVAEPWVNYFKKLGNAPEVQKLQLEDVLERLWPITMRDATLYKARDARDIALFFDTAVQMNGTQGRNNTISGPMAEYTRNNVNATGQTRRLAWARMIAKGAKPRWQKDVLSRRALVARGEGKVHGNLYDLDDWGLQPTVIDLDAIKTSSFTWMPAQFPEPKPPGESNAPTSPPVSVAAGALDLKDNFVQCLAAALSQVQRSDIDHGAWGPVPSVPVRQLIENAGTALTDQINNDWQTNWSTSRQSIALCQLIALANGLNPGPIDGLWGTRTGDAYDDLDHYRRHGVFPDKTWRDRDPIVNHANPNGWPRQSVSELTRFYGAPGRVPLVRVPVPWTIVLSWETHKRVRAMSVHRKVAPSLKRVLDRVHQHYGDEELKRLGLHLFGGAYNDRNMRHSTRKSTHAWGIAIDWDDTHNRLKWGRDKARLARPEYDAWWDIWEAEGWVSLGRVKNFDWMHIQAAKL